MDPLIIRMIEARFTVNAKRVLSSPFMLSLQDARSKLLGAGPPLEVQTLPLEEAVGRILRETLSAESDRPEVDRAAMDGFALRFEDLKKGETLNCTREIFAGELDVSPLQPGEAVRVATGAALPNGTDTVLRKEYAKQSGAQLTVLKMPRLGQDLRVRGEEWRKGAPLLSAGQRLSPAMIAVAAALGRPELQVQCLPRVRVCSSGDEIAASGADRVQDSNGPFLRAFCREQGVEALDGGRLPDDPVALQAQIGKALQDLDLLITSGGMSVGDRDGMVSCVQALGGTLLFHGVQIRPGRPIGAAKIQDCLWLMLPGSPGAVMAGAELFLAPLLASLGVQSLACRAPQRVQFGADLSKKTDQASSGGPRRFRWGKLDKGPQGWRFVSPRGLDVHHLLTPLASEGYAVDTDPPSDWVDYVGQGPALALSSPPEPSKEVGSAGPTCVAITGPSGSGKTTLIRRLLQHLSQTKRVAVIKHSHHPVPPEPPHKDTARFLQAGAASVLFVSGSELVLRQPGPAWTRPALERWVAQLNPQPELILVEGFSAFPGPRLEFLGPQDPRGAKELQAQGPELLACIVRGRPAPELSIPVFDAESVESIAAWLTALPGWRFL